MSKHVRAFALALLAVSMTGTAHAAPAQDLAKLCDDYWQGHLRANPVAATSIGDDRYDDQLSDITPAGIERDEARLESVLARARAIDPKALNAADQLTRAALIEEIEDELAASSCRMEQWVVDPLGGPQVDIMNLPDYTALNTPAQGDKFVKRCRRMGRYFDDHIANLRLGLGQGKVASRSAVEKTIDQIDKLVSGPVESLALLAPARAAHPKWPAEQKQRFARELRAAVTDTVVPALVRYRDFLKRDVLPVARAPEKAGLAALPGGVECYRKMIRVHTSLDMTPEELHQLGLQQVAKFRQDLSALGSKTLGTSDVREIENKLRTDPEMHFSTAEEVESKARETLARAQAAMPKWFGAVKPKTACNVKVMGMHEAPYSTIAYYRQPSADGKRPGQYMINTYMPETRPRYEAEALAFHESVPGHHLQIAVAQELTRVPEFRKHQGVTAFVEGWGLYSERLADEMGLYSSDVDRLGMLSYDAWRSCRLVVDTGLHAMGWSRQQAIDYMKENSCLAENNIANEVDRYITWPGQALAYKVGQLEILRLRDEAKQKLGARFDIKAFHDVVLGNGAIALPVLREQVENYIKQAAGSQ
ncbi:MAG TPA: DUF885 domain-containing protein [Candidatus Eisenbacteria bacterium]|nr:DUF885 domain-containing protein [Candidatus Eisenbacteria bacterium]